MECTYIYHQDGEESPPNSSYIQSLFFIYPVFIAQLRRYIAPEYIPPESMFTEHSVCTVLCADVCTVYTKSCGDCTLSPSKKNVLHPI